MFPLPWNFPFRKKDGTIVNVVDAMGGGGGGGSDLPDYDSSDAGKVLGVDENGDLEWSDELSNYSNVVARHQSVEVSGDGVKTFEQLGLELRTAIQAVATVLPSNQAIIITHGYFAGNGNVQPVMGYYYYSSGDTISTLEFAKPTSNSGANPPSSTLFHSYIHTSNSLYDEIVTTSNGITITGKKSTVVTNGNKFRLYYDIVTVPA